MRDGFYLGTVEAVKMRKYDYKITFHVRTDFGEFYPILILDLDIMDKKSAHFLISAAGHGVDIPEALNDCIGKEVAILVKDFGYSKVILTYPGDMIQILSENEEAFIGNWINSKTFFLDYIMNGLNASFFRSTSEPLDYDEIFDYDFAKKLCEFKEQGLPYKIPTDYYAEDSNPFNSVLL